MLLAIDTATRWTGLALYDGNKTVAEYGWHATNTQTIEVAPTIADMLRKTSVTFDALDGIAVAIGPGSYTGLRVGMGLAKGIALAHKLPLIGIGTLDVLVANYEKREGYLVPICEAGRTRVCAATYRYYSRKAWQVKESADIYTWADLIAHVPDKTHFVGEISADARRLIRDAKKSLTAATAAEGTRRAGLLAELAWRRLRKGDVDDAAALVPVYLRDPGGAKTN